MIFSLELQARANLVVELYSSMVRLRACWAACLMKVSLRLLLLDSTRSLGLTIGTPLSNRTLAATTPHGDTVDDESLLGLVSQPASFVWPGWARSTVDLGQLAILPAPDPEQ